MQRWKITIEYNGTPYCGWQRQKDDHIHTIEEALLKALKGVFSCDIPLHGAGRTDSGVHAIEQVAHFDTDKDIPDFKVRDGLNYYLRYESISILKAEKVPSDFHARFSAVQRQYIYRISNRRAPLTFKENMVWYTGGYPLDAKKMHEAAQLLVGTHDFTTFRCIDAVDQHPVRTMDYITIESVGEEIHLKCGARSFIHNQVRYITGALFRIGYGKWDAEKLQEVLDAKDRNKGGQLAPPHGLYLSKVVY